MNWSARPALAPGDAIATGLILVVGLALALLLARTEFPGRTVLEALILLPLVLPPSVIGYYLLLALAAAAPLVEWLTSGWSYLAGRGRRLRRSSGCR